ncbi:MAG: hypothetical protein LHV69_11725 [Elusimicrobia bacterium]|nr:hypothetical protein [Candidatus Obscuribacterium magneticum]
MAKAELFIDVGGTKIRFILNRHTGASRHSRESGNPVRHPPQRIRAFNIILDSGFRRNDDMRHLIEKGIQKLHLPIKPRFLIVGMRGVWTPPERSCWQSALKGLAKKVLVMSDVELAHRLAFGRGPGVVLNAGTGSIAFGRSSTGRSARAGGLGPLLGDEGSAFWMGREYLKMRTAQGGKLEGIRSYGLEPGAVARVARLSTEVLRRAKRKNRECQKIVDGAHHHLLNLLEILHLRLGLKAPVKLKLTGGLFENSYFRNRFIGRLKGKGSSRDMRHL